MRLIATTFYLAACLWRKHPSSSPSQTRGYIHRKTWGKVQLLPRTWPVGYTPVVPFTTNVVTVGLTAETVTGVTRRTPPMGTVRRMVPGCPGAPFSTTWNTRAKYHQCNFQAWLDYAAPLRPVMKTHVVCTRLR